VENLHAEVEINSASETIREHFGKRESWLLLTEEV
jgi:hypothetical protein